MRDWEPVGAEPPVLVPPVVGVVESAVVSLVVAEACAEAPPVLARALAVGSASEAGSAQQDGG